LKFPRNETYLHQVLGTGIAETGNATALLAALLEQLEGTLLGDVAELAELQDGLLASGLLAAGYNATTLGLDQILLVETTGSVLGSAVENLGLGADSLLRATHHSGIVLTGRRAVLAGSTTSIGHFFLMETQKKIYRAAVPKSSSITSSSATVSNTCAAISGGAFFSIVYKVFFRVRCRCRIRCLL
jgi:hypothetical protein